MPEMATSDRHSEHAEARPERARWPRLAAAPHPRLRALLPRGYVGFTEATTPGGWSCPRPPRFPWW